MTLSRQLGIIHAFARITAAFVWLYHGIVPKLLLINPDELKLIQAGGISAEDAVYLLPIIGITEAGIGLLLLATWPYRWPLFLSAAAMAVALAGVAITSPAYLTGAFNPVSLNAATFSLSVIGALSLVKAELPIKR